MVKIIIIKEETTQIVSHVSICLPIKDDKLKSSIHKNGLTCSCRDHITSFGLNHWYNM